MKPAPTGKQAGPNGVTNRYNDDKNIDLSLSDMYAFHSGGFQARTGPIAAVASGDAVSMKEAARSSFVNDMPTSIESNDITVNTSQANVNRKKHSMGILGGLELTTLKKSIVDGDLKRAVVHEKPINNVETGILYVLDEPYSDEITAIPNGSEKSKEVISTSNDLDAIEHTGRTTGASRFTGVVCYRKNIYRAQIGVNRKVYTVGIYRLETDAAFAYDQATKSLRRANLGTTKGRKWKTNFDSFEGYNKARAQDLAANRTDAHVDDDLSTVAARAQRYIESIILKEKSRRKSEENRESEPRNKGIDDSVGKFRNDYGRKINSSESFHDGKRHATGTIANSHDGVRLQNDPVSGKNVDDDATGRDGKNDDAGASVDSFMRSSSHPRPHNKAQKAAVTVSTSLLPEEENGNNGITPDPHQAMSPSLDSKDEAILLEAATGNRTVWSAKKKEINFSSNDSTMTNCNLNFSTTNALYHEKFDGTPISSDECTGRIVEEAGISFGVKKASSSRFKGVCYVEQQKTYRSQISINGKVFSIGNYGLESTAALAYDETVKHLLRAKPTNEKSRNRRTNFKSLSEYETARAQELNEKGLDVNTEVSIPAANAKIQRSIVDIMRKVESTRRIKIQDNEPEEFKAGVSDVLNKGVEGADNLKPVIEDTVLEAIDMSIATNAKRVALSRNATSSRLNPEELPEHDGRSFVERGTSLKPLKTIIDRVEVSRVRKRAHEGKLKSQKNRALSDTEPLGRSAIDEVNSRNDALTKKWGPLFGDQDWLTPAFMESYQKGTENMLAGLRKTYVHFKRNSGLQQPAVKPSTISDSNYLSASSASTKDPVMRKQGGNDENVQLQQLSLPKAPAKTTKGDEHDATYTQKYNGFKSDYMCSHCKKAFKSEGGLLYHLHHNVCEFKVRTKDSCNLSSKECNSEYSLTYHMDKRVCRKRSPCLSANRGEKRVDDAVSADESAAAASKICDAFKATGIHPHTPHWFDNNTCFNQDGSGDTTNECFSEQMQTFLSNYQKKLSAVETSNDDKEHLPPALSFGDGDMPFAAFDSGAPKVYVVNDRAQSSSADKMKKKRALPSDDTSADENASFKPKFIKKSEREPPNRKAQPLVPKGIISLKPRKSDLIPLQKEQASSLPFPVGCDVWWAIHLNSKGESFKHGQVSAVYFNFSTCAMIYEVLPAHCEDKHEEASITLLNEEELAYAPGCPVYYSSSGRFENEINLAHGEILCCRTSHRGNYNTAKGLGENLQKELDCLKLHVTDKACHERIRDLLLKLDTEVVIDRTILEQTGIGRTVKSVSKRLANICDEGVTSAKKIIEKWRSQITVSQFYYTMLIFCSGGSDETLVLQDISSTKVKLRGNSDI